MKYSDAGVDISKADKAMKKIGSIVRETFTPGVKADFGSFGGLFSLKELNLKSPILVSSVDGVGTKIKLSIESGKPNFAGEDIVNHCVGDILVQGARPLFFLDYYATGLLHQDTLVKTVEGIAKACKENNCALLGGETAEMPGFYQKEDFDLAGTIVGVAEEEQLITGKNISNNDTLIGLKSSGLHTNGYSLARKVLFEKQNYKLNDKPYGLEQSLGKILTRPHRSYLKPLWPLVEQKKLKGLIHITGSGFQGNIPRVLPNFVDAEINRKAWEIPPIYKIIQKDGDVETDEMYNTFNMGIGMVLVIDTSELPTIKAHFDSINEPFWNIGRIVSKTNSNEKATVKFVS